MRNLVLGLSLSVAFIIGCLAGPAIRPTVVPPVKAANAPKAAKPATAVPKWEYACFQVGPYPKEINRWGNKAGLSGWEMVSSAYIGFKRQSIWCFKRQRL